MIDQFHELLFSLGEQLKLPLQPDKRGACKLNIRNLFSIQIEYEPSRDRILIASFLCDIPPGKLRENILKDALKANFPFPEMGSLGYCERNNKLALFLYVPLSGLSGEKCASILTAFIEKANAWREAVPLGQTSTLVESVKPSELKPFNLKP
jgi:hypothetical protein